MRETTNHTSCCLVTKGQVSLDKKLTWQMFGSIFVQKRKFNVDLCQNKIRNVFFSTNTLPITKAQRPSIDLNERFLPRPNTAKA